MVNNYNLLRTLDGHSAWVMCSVFSSDDLKIVSGSADKTLKVWDAVTYSLIKTLEDHMDTVKSVIFSKDN